MRSLTVVLLLLSVSLSGAAWSGNVVHNSFESSTLDRSYPYNIYLPDGYEDSGLDYPVLYLLHGASGSEQSWVRAGNIESTADRLIAKGSIPPQLIVMPADPNYWWADSHAEAARQAFVDDLLPHIDSRYRTIEDRAGRSVAGYSAGGYGTANLVLAFPQLFAAAAPLSPAVYHPVPPASSSATRIAIFQRNGEFDPQLWQSLNWVSFFDSYRNSGFEVPFFISSGDHDRFDIAYHAAAFFQALREHQPALVELRIFDGDHDFAAWGTSISDAMEYMAQFLATPR